jgi:Ca2+-binding RTX toxin-like protein
MLPKISSLALAAALLALAAPAAEAAKPTASIEGRTLTVVGTARADTIALRIDPDRTNRVDVDFGDDGTPDFSFAHKTFGRISVAAGDGPDQVRIDEANGAIPAPTTIDGEGGRDTLSGGAGAERIDGGDGGDTVDGGAGDDTVDLGAGPDRLTWEPGDGSDNVRGGDGNDRVTFGGSDDAEAFRLVAKGTHARLTRDLDHTGMPLREVERVDVLSQDGDDTLTVGDLTGTGVTTVMHEDAGTGADRTIVKGTNRADGIVARGRDGHAKITGLAATVSLHHADPADDTLALEARRGADIVSADTLARSAVKLTADGGGDEDTVFGGHGDDVLSGGGANDLILGHSGSDTVDGGAGDDLALLGGGDDRFAWGSGDGDDTIEGEAGHDTLSFTGTDARERIDLSSNGGRLRLTRNIAHIRLDANRLESVEIHPLGGEDRVFVGALNATAVRSVTTDLADAEPDVVTVDGTDRGEFVGITGLVAAASIVSGGPTVLIASTDPAVDLLTYRARGGDDVVSAAAVRAGASILLQIDGGDGDDTLIGGEGDDTIFGGPKDDVLFGGPGNDTLDGGPGDNIVIQD